MAKRTKKQEDAWAHAKKLCGLDARQVEMARALGMNPRRLPSLRPRPQQKWKLPVGVFIEECYRARFGEDDLDTPGVAPPVAGDDVRTRTRPFSPNDLLRFLDLLATDLEEWIRCRFPPQETLAYASRELRAVADLLDREQTDSSPPQVGEDDGYTPDDDGYTPDDDRYTPDDDIPF